MLQPSQLRPEVAEARRVLHQDMVKRWKTDLAEPLKRYYFIATICDPRQKNLRFPGVDPGLRAVAHAWFESEYDAIWAPPPTQPAERAPAASPAAASPASHPQYQGATFLHFMAGLSHLEGTVQQEVEEVAADEGVLEAVRYLESTEVCRWRQIFWSGGLPKKANTLV